MGATKIFLGKLDDWWNRFTDWVGVVAGQDFIGLGGYMRQGTKAGASGHGQVMPTGRPTSSSCATSQSTVATGQAKKRWDQITVDEAINAFRTAAAIVDAAHPLADLLP